jgi:hypothetical protein
MNMKESIIRGLLTLSIIAGVGLFLDPSRGRGEDSANLVLEKYRLAVEQGDISGIERLTRSEQTQNTRLEQRGREHIDLLKGCQLATEMERGDKPGEESAVVTGNCEYGPKYSRLSFRYDGGSIINMFRGKWYLVGIYIDIPKPIRVRLPDEK